MITANDAFDEWNYRIALLCTLCLKKVSTIKLSVTLSNVNWFFKFLIARKLVKFATQMFNISHHTLPMLLHYLGKFESSNLLQIRKIASIFAWIHLM